jgi:hypothetical protein
MNHFTLNNILTYIIASIWFINGLFCKVLNLVPRHQLIVATILDTARSRQITVLIGLSEICMAVWILSGRYARLNVVFQIMIIVTMNILEFLLVPELLLWGKANALFALLLVYLIFINEYYFRPKPGIAN